MKATQKPSAGEQIKRWNDSQKTVVKLLKITMQLYKNKKKADRRSQEKPKKEHWIWLLMVSGWRQGSIV